MDMRPTRGKDEGVCLIQFSDIVDGVFQIIQVTPNWDDGFWQQRSFSVTIPEGFSTKAFEKEIRRIRGIKRGEQATKLK